MKIEIQYHGVMMSDYFSGTSGVMISCYFNSTTTNQDIINQIKSEISDLWNHVEYTAQYHNPDCDMDQLKPDIDQAILDLEKQNDMDLIFYPDFVQNFEGEDFSEDMDCPVAIFSIEFIKED
jgi:hypothetical protein